jgi:hypothetical protein
MLERLGSRSRDPRRLHLVRGRRLDVEERSCASSRV